MFTYKNTIEVHTKGESLVEITTLVQKTLDLALQSGPQEEGVADGFVYLFLQHTSAGLTITESYDPEAKEDVEEFLKRLAPREASFIRHKTEGPDDSPSHMKSVLLGPTLLLAVEKGKIVLGTWQGIFLAEFRDDPRKRQIYFKYVSDRSHP